MTSRSRFFRCALLTVWAVGISGDADAYRVNVISSGVSVSVLATGGSDSDTGGKSASRVANGIATAVQVDRLGNVVNSVAFGESILVIGALQVLTLAETNVRSRGDAPFTGSALSNVSGEITFSVEKRAEETLPLLLELETELTPLGSRIGQVGLEGESFVFTLENLTTHQTLHDSRLAGYPALAHLSGLVGDVFKISYFGSLELNEGTRPYTFGREFHRTSLVISGAEIPEPGTALFAAFGLAALGRLGRKRLGAA